MALCEGESERSSTAPVWGQWNSPDEQQVVEEVALMFCNLQEGCEINTVLHGQHEVHLLLQLGEPLWE